MTSLLQVIWAVGALVGVLALSVLTTRVLGGRLLPGLRTQRLRVQEHLALGREGGLWLVEAAGRMLLLGTAGRGVTLLADLTAAEPADGWAPAGTPGGTGSEWAPAAIPIGSGRATEADRRERDPVVLARQLLAGRRRASEPVTPSGFGAALEASLRRLRHLSGDERSDA